MRMNCDIYPVGSCFHGKTHIPLSFILLIYPFFAISNPPEKRGETAKERKVDLERSSSSSAGRFYRIRERQNIYDDMQRQRESLNLCVQWTEANERPWVLASQRSDSRTWLVVFVRVVCVCVRVSETSKNIVWNHHTATSYSSGSVRASRPYVDWDRPRGVVNAQLDHRLWGCSGCRLVTKDYLGRMMA